MIREDFEELCGRLKKISWAIFPGAPDCGGAEDASGVFVGSLTEAVMGVTKSIQQTNEILREISGYLRESK